MMAEKIIKKKYYKISFELASPLALGSGDNENTDKDLIRDASGKPYIPASSIAGVIREQLEKDDKTKMENYLGKVDRNTKDTEAYHEESKVIFYDGTITEGSPYITVRDSVALDEFKTAKKGAKFDVEILEPGVRFTTYLEQDFTKSYGDDYGAEIAKVFLSQSLSFGGKSMRGYGLISDVRVQEKTFDIQNDIDEWLKWLERDIYDLQNVWDKCDIKSALSQRKEIRLTLKQEGGISIRRYTSSVSTKDNTEPDMEQLTVGKNKKKPVIPGTSWAGAIRHRMGEFGIDIEGENSIFGYVQGEGKDSKSRSRLSFSESTISGGTFKTLSRNAIDRFTGGTVNGALFTEKTYYGGECELVIGWKSDEEMPEKEKKAMAAALTDLHFGFLAVGGETSIGRGLFSIISINDQKLPEASGENGNEIFGKVLANIEEAFK